MAKRAVSTNVDLKIIFSNPLLVKEDWPDPKDLPKPVPLDWIKIAPIKSVAIII